MTGVIVAGMILFGGGIADKYINGGDANAYNVVTSYENTIKILGEEGKLDQLPEMFDSKKIADAYTVYNAQQTRQGIDDALVIVGLMTAAVGWAAPVRYDKRLYPTE
jgi:hypothetical protein